jgi:hypothetical protein
MPFEGRNVPEKEKIHALMTKNEANPIKIAEFS